MNMCVRSIGVAGAAGAALLALSAGTSSAQDFEFRVNAAPTALGLSLHPPTIGLVYSGDGYGGYSTDSMAFSWPDDAIAAVAIPFCDLQCPPGSFQFVDEGFGGGGQSFPEGLYLRRFNHAGVPLDAADVVLATAGVFDSHGGFLTPSIALRKVNSGLVTQHPFRLAWWDMWAWTDQATPCGGPACFNQPVGWWSLFYADLIDPLPSGGSANFLDPAWCRAHRPSATYAKQDDLVAWRDVAGPCRQIVGAFNGAYPSPPFPPPIVIRPSQDGIGVDRPCAGSSSEHFVVAWREDDLATFSSSIRVRRVYPTGALGPIVDVTSFGAAYDRSGPAVSVFDDGSFVVQYIGFDNGDPPLLPILIARFDDQDPPNQIFPTIIVEPHNNGLNHTVSARGLAVSSVLNPTIHLASAYELPDGQGLPLNVFARSVNSVTGDLGDRIVVPIDPEEPLANRLGEAHQHTALLRSDELLATAWYSPFENNNYCSVRVLPPPAPPPVCDSLDFNNDGIFPDNQDLVDLISVFAGGPCSTDPFPGCNDIDFNNDGIFPDNADITAYVIAFGGGPCP
jgi:hypothetical protein